ncbi:MAG: rod shape-determining protein MreD [Chloroflexi bacterium]|nr:rod shape-determining protein MreD [Chloroflexota bacterium]
MQLGNTLGIPLLIFAAVLNTTLMPEFRLGNGAPDLVFMLVVSWALLADVRQGLFWAVVGGVLQDMLSVAPLGASALGLVLVAYGADATFGDVHRRNLIIPPLVAAVGTVLYHISLLIVLELDGIDIALGQALFYVTLPTVIYNSVLIVPIFRLLGVVHLWLQPRRVRLE